MYLPAWLVEAYQRAPDGDRAGDRFLENVQWGQYCLFLMVRMQDDLFDGQAASPSLIYAADQILVGSVRAFAQHFPRASRFWSIFYDALQTTTRAIVEVDAIQRSPKASKRTLPEKYAAVAAVLNVSSAAVCVTFRRMRDYPRIARFAGEMAIVGQVIDDLQDIEEDWRRKRCNYATGMLYESRPRAPGRGMRRRRIVPGDPLNEDAVGRLLRGLREHLDKALRSIAPLGMAGPAHYIARHLHALERAEGSLHRARVGALLGEPLGVWRRRQAPSFLLGSVDGNRGAYSRSWRE